MKKSRLVHKDLRVLQKKMVYCSGIPSDLSKEEICSDCYFGQYGTVTKAVLNPYPNRNYCSVYLTFSHQFEAATAIIACNQFQINRSTLWCLFGTMKYCKFFMRKTECKNLSSCPYLHEFDEENEIEIQNSPSESYPYHYGMAKKIIQKYPDLVAKIDTQKIKPGNLPGPKCALDFLQEELVQEQSDSQEQLLPPISKPILSQKNQKQQSVHKKNQKIFKPTLNLDSLIKKLIIKQLEKASGSRLLKGIKNQEKGLREIIIQGLLE